MIRALFIQRNDVDAAATSPPFYFMTAIGEYTGVAAVSLHDFREKLKTVDIRSLVFHLHRRDFQRWIMDQWHLDKLVQDLNVIQKKGFEGECLRQQLLAVVTIHMTD